MTATTHGRPETGAGSAPSSIRVTNSSSSAMSGTRRLVACSAGTGGGLLRRHLRWCLERQRDLEGCSPAGRRLQHDAAAELPRHQIIDDVQSKPSAALAAPRREERIEDMALDVLRHG